MAFSAAGIVLLLLASAFPFLSFAASGREVSMNLLDSALALFEHDQDVLGIVVFTLIFVGPLALLINQSTLLWLLLKNQRTPWLGRLARGLEALKTWNMIEVFLVSVFVSAAKLASMAQLELGAAFFAFVGFTLCTLISVHLIDEVQLWRRIQAIGS